MGLFLPGGSEGRRPESLCVGRRGAGLLAASRRAARSRRRRDVSHWEARRATGAWAASCREVRRAAGPPRSLFFLAALRRLCRRRAGMLRGV